MSKVKSQLSNEDYVSTLARVSTSAPQRSEERKSKKRATLEPLRTNRGVHGNDNDYISLVLSDGEVKKVLKRSDSKNSVFIDWISLSVNIEGYLKYEKIKGFTHSEKKGIQQTETIKSFTDDDIARAISAKLQNLLGEGFGISKKNPFGLNFHRDSYVIGENYGTFCIGHKNNRFLISISGEGCGLLDKNKIKNLHDWLAELNNCNGDVRLSRVDLAVDYYDGITTHDDFSLAYHAGEFVRQKRHKNCKDMYPAYQIYGCVHTQRGLDAGITHAIGSRTSDLYFRLYDKGRQLGDSKSPWQRAELEMKSKDTLLTIDMLINPETYFAQYPFLEKLKNSIATKFETKQRRAEITVERSKEIIKNQFGKYLYVLRALVDSDKELLDQLQSDTTEFPVKMGFISPAGFTPIHKHPVFDTVAFADLENYQNTDFKIFTASDLGSTDGNSSIMSH
jgi:phage replication initiation protein